MFPVKKDTVSTDFLPAERTPPEEIKKAFHAISSHSLLTQLLDAMPMICLLLNKERQIVFANKATVAFLELEDRYALSGLRPGEALHCVHAFERDDGCGTTAYCRMCGTARALRNQHGWHEDSYECSILRSNGMEALDLRVSSVPINIDRRPFIVFTMIDISHQKRRSALERIFFHDILNTAGTIRGFSELLADRTGDDAKKHLGLIRQLSTRLVEEIEGHRELRAAENNELQVRPAAMNARKLLEEIEQQYQGQPPGKGRHVHMAPEAEEVSLTSDPVLLRRAIGNLVKNALEASLKDGVVLVGAKAADGGVEFWVRNSEPMDPEVQLQVFQRSFSTKGSGRGLGTFGVKLITENYLKGKVSFESSPETGTVFRITCPKDFSN
jgi:signal transduction histidine kinase